MAIVFLALGIMFFWFTVYAVAAIFIQKITDQFPSARAIGLLREMINKFKEQKPNEFIISIDKKVSVDSSREILISSDKTSIHFSENDAKMLIIHLLSIYPEMDNPEKEESVKPENKDLTP